MSSCPMVESDRQLKLALGGHGFAGPAGPQTVIAALSDAAGNVGLATNVFLLTAYTTGEYTGDAAGCVTQIVYRGPGCEASRTLQWDSEYRLVGVSTNGVFAESYTYDPLRRRIAITAGDGTVTRHLWDGPHVLADLDATGGVLRTYVYGPEIDELLAIEVFTTGSPQTYYTIRDHQNTVWALVNGNGIVVEYYDYDAWGRVLTVRDRDGTELAGSAIGNRYLFHGREYSWSTGLYYFRARWYDPVTGRWLCNDPIGISGGLNQYVFCANNPVNFRDPWGLCEQYRNGDQTLERIRTFFDAGQDVADTTWWPDWYIELTTMLALHSGPRSPLDFNAQDDGRDFLVNGSPMGFDEFGNYVAGYSAGYADTPGLYTGVRIGGLGWAALPGGEHWTDRDSVPAINQGFDAGRAARDRRRGGR